jgi:hypothetical protein
MNYWIAISSNLDRRKTKNAQLANTWWCFPTRATPGDLVAFYLPRSVNGTYHGVYAIYEVVSSIHPKHSRNHYCSAYRSKNESLKYAEVRPVKHFVKALTCSTMKNSSLKTSPFVRRNFQGTIFQITQNEFAEITRMLDSINEPESQ